MTNRSIFYGWWVVAAFSVTTFMSTGVRHAVGPFLKPIVADLGLDRASFSAVIALSLFLYGVFMPIAGMALDVRRDRRRDASGAAPALSLGAPRLSGVGRAVAGRRHRQAGYRRGAGRTGHGKRGAADAGVLAARRLVLHLRLLDEPALRARHPDAHRPRLHADVRVLDDGRARRLGHRVHGNARCALRPLRSASRAGRDLRGPRRGLQRALPGSAQPDR